jgi:hypothetical protein
LPDRQIKKGQTIVVRNRRSIDSQENGEKEGKRCDWDIEKHDFDYQGRIGKFEIR